MQQLLLRNESLRISFRQSNQDNILLFVFYMIHQLSLSKESGNLIKTSNSIIKLSIPHESSSYIKPITPLILLEQVKFENFSQIHNQNKEQFRNQIQEQERPHICNIQNLKSNIQMQGVQTNKIQDA
ncbi:unnamed protein product [Paramecium octaurelia]|uniref:Uncharacterized protein n=1 Tax=Paramecium octaurelia TaxID=43137 RepID=A0A8S1VP47_PAROT|nr:unnamed protein product [Paramecium octaurelia]